MENTQANQVAQQFTGSFRYGLVTVSKAGKEYFTGVVGFTNASGGQDQYKVTSFDKNTVAYAKQYGAYGENKMALSGKNVTLSSKSGFALSSYSNKYELLFETMDVEGCPFQAPAEAPQGYSAPAMGIQAPNVGMGLQQPGMMAPGAMAAPGMMQQPTAMPGMTAPQPGMEMQQPAAMPGMATPGMMAPGVMQQPAPTAEMQQPAAMAAPQIPGMMAPGMTGMAAPGVMAAPQIPGM